MKKLLLSIIGVLVSNLCIASNFYFDFGTASAKLFNHISDTRRINLHNPETLRSTKAERIFRSGVGRDHHSTT